MSIYTLVSLIITLAALIAFLNKKTLQLETTIAIMSGSLLISISLIAFGALGFQELEFSAVQQLFKLDFHAILMQGMLSFLLFAGAMQIDLQWLSAWRLEIAILAGLSTLLSTLLVGLLSYYCLAILGVQLPWVHCLLFGALISPTDPIAVLAIFRKVGAPKSLDIIMAGESLLNDGVGIVLYTTLYYFAFSHHHIGTVTVAQLFLTQTLGGLAFGAVLGLLGHHSIALHNQDKVDILLSLAITTGGYVLAEQLGVSGPLAMVVAGIIIGNRGRLLPDREAPQNVLDTFWEVVDEILNAILFLLIGFELLLLQHTLLTFVCGLLAIPLILISRTLSVALPFRVLKTYRHYPPMFTRILIWGGLRGGLAVALALALPQSPEREIILAMTYASVVFAIIVQGLSIKSWVARLS